MSRGGVIRLTWALDVVDRGAGKQLLKQDRQIRRSLNQTDQTYRRMSRTAGSVAAHQTAASRQTERGHRSAGRGAAFASSQERRLAAAQREALSAGARLITQENQIASAHRRRGRAAREASVSERVAARAQNVGKGGSAAAGAVGGKLGNVRGAAAGAGLALGLAAVTGDAVGFEKQMSKVGARLLTTGSNMRKLSDFAIELGANTQFSAREAAGAMDELAAGGFSVKEIFKTLPGTLSLAASSGTDLATAAEIQTNALRGFGLQAGQASHVADVLAKVTNKSAVDMEDLGEMLPYVSSTARQTGTSFEQVAAAAGVLGNAGIKGSMAGTALRTSMLRLTDPSKKMVGILDGIGLSSKQLAAVPLPKVIGLISDRIKGLPRGRQVGIISAIFGKEAAPSMLNLMSKGRKSLDRMADGYIHANGFAEKSAKVMRNNVAGAWDNFTGSVEAASLKLTRRFMPAIKGALNAVAGGVDKGSGSVSDFMAGLAGEKPRGRTRVKTRVVAAGPGGRGARRVAVTRDVAVPTGPGGQAVRTRRVAVRERVPARPQSGAQRLGAQVRGFAIEKALPALKNAGKTAGQIGKDLIAALKPAVPFFQNVLLPLLTGFGKGILASVVVAFKIAIPVIKVFSSVLGFIGRAAKPLKPVFDLIGQGVALLFGGLILKAVGGLSKLGGVFKIVGGAAKVLAVPVGFVTKVFRAVPGAIGKVAGAFGRIGGIIGRAVGFYVRLPVRIAGVAGRMVSAGGRLVAAGARGLAKLPGRLAGLAGSAGKSLINRLGSFAGSAASAGGRIVKAIVRPFTSIGGKILSAIGSGGKAMLGFVKGLANGVIGFAERAINSVDRIGKGKLSIKVPDVKLPRFRRGGRAGYRSGGMVDVAVSSGEELVFPGGGSMIVPGPRVAADNVFTSVPHGTAVLTDHGQALRSAGMSLGGALANQVPHFRKGGLAAINRVYPGHSLAAARGKAQLSSLQVRAAAENAGFSPARAVQADQITRGESVRYPGVISSDGGHGLMQHTPRVWGALAKGWMSSLGGLAQMRNPIRNMKMAKKLSDDAVKRGKDMWSPWYGTRYLDRSIDAGKVNSVLNGRRLTGSSSATVRLPDKLSFAGSLPKPQYEAGMSATPLRQSIGDIVTGATARLEKRTKTVSGSAGRGAASPKSGRGGFTPGGGWAGTENLVRHAIRGLKGQRITYKRSRAINNNQNSDHNTWIKNAFAADISPGGDGVFSLIGRRLGIGARKGVWNKFPGRPVKGFRSQLLWHAPDGSHKDHVHLGIRRLRRGGIAGALSSFRPGGRVRGKRGSSVADRERAEARSLTSRAGGPLGALLPRLKRLKTGAPRPAVAKVFGEFADEIGQVDEVTGEILRQRLTDIRARIARLRRGGIKKNERGRYRSLLSEGRGAREQLGRRDQPISYGALGRMDSQLERRITAVSKGGGAKGNAGRVQLQRLKAAQRVVQTEMLRRLDFVSQTVEKQATLLERDRAKLSRTLRIEGIDESSSRGIARIHELTGAQVKAMRRQESKLEVALKRAKRLGDRGAVQTIGDQLNQLRDDMAEAVATWFEQIRQQILAAAQERVDTAQFNLDIAQGSTSALEANQRLLRIDDTPAGMVQRADQIRGSIIPALEGQRQAAIGQFAAAWQVGDVATIRQAASTIQQSGTDIAAAMADAADLVRDAALKAAQDVVDISGSGTSMAQLGYARLELEERIAGSYDNSGQDRANYINQTIIPALNAELAALQSQAQTAAEQGDAVLARQVAEAIAGKQNDILQATLDATEQVASNTDQAKEYRTSLGFAGVGGETTTDLLGSGTGA